MEINVRKPNIEKLTSKNIPKDFEEVKDYFNKALEEKSLPWIPRKTPITNKEIKEKWIPSLNKNICYVAESKGEIVGCATVFYDPNSTNYENKDKRSSGELVFTASSKTNYIEVCRKNVKKIIDELKKQNKKAQLNISIESPSNKSLSELGYKGKEKFLEHYKKNGMSGKVIGYNLP